jgi:hypothetical protein
MSEQENGFETAQQFVEGVHTDADIGLEGYRAIEEDAEAGKGFGSALEVGGMPLGFLSMWDGFGELGNKQYSQGLLDVSSGATGAAAGAATIAGDEMGAAALGPVGLALGLGAMGNKYTTDIGLWGTATDAETGQTHNRTGFERMEDDVSQAYEDYGVLGAAGEGLVEGVETIGADLLGGVASAASSIAKGIGSIFSW